MSKAKSKKKKVAIQKAKIKEKCFTKKEAIVLFSKTAKLSFHMRLAKVQNELKVPKGKKNVYGGFNYRSCEDVLREVKPLLAKHGLHIILTDDIVRMRTRFYVKATVAVFDLQSEHIFTSTGYAREEDAKKGMDGSQVTGASSSYARKYALNGIFGIDDGIDSDTTGGVKTVVKNENALTEVEVKDLAKFLGEINNAKDITELKKVGERFMAGAKIGKFNDAQVAVMKKAFTGQQKLLATKK